PLLPTTPYAASKAAADLASYQYTQSAGLDIVRARPFNHMGPRQSADFASAAFAKQVAAIECGEQAPQLQTGNLSPARDVTDVRDMVDAYVRIMRSGQTGEAYNIGTGKVASMQTVVEGLLKLARVPIELRTDPKLVRAKDAPIVCADA